jgi:hypothetical protein
MHFLERNAGVLEPPGAGQGVDVPERAQRERAFVPGQPVGRSRWVVAVDQAVGHQLAVHGLQRGQPQWVAWGDEALQRHHQQRGVEHVGVVMLGERADPGIPAALHDLAVGPVPLDGPLDQVAGPAAALGQPDGAVQGHPDLEPAVGEVLAAATGLPDPFVRLVPVLAQPVDDLRHRHPALVRQLHALDAVTEDDRVHRLAVDVELELAGGAVPDPHRPGAAPALEVIERLLGQVRAAIDPVHDPQRARAVLRLVRGAVLEPVAEPGGLVEVTEPEQRVDGERAVPDPGVAVVPVALAAFLLGQPGGRRGDRRAGGRIGHQLECHGRPGDHLAPAAGIGRAAQPGAPEASGLVGQALGLLGRYQVRRVPHPLQHHAADLARSHRAGPAQALAVFLGLDPEIVDGLPGPGDAVHGQVGAAGTEHHTALGDFDLVRCAAVIEARPQVNPEVHLAPHHVDAAHQPVPLGRRGPGDRHEVVDLAHPIRGHEPGDQDGGVGEIELPADIVVAIGPDPAVTALVRVEQGREHAGRVEPGTAEPVDAAVGGHQRGGLQVADQPVVADVGVARQGTHLV